jgi:acyl-CoA synthetase (AMP-forming)/AMP-acid ligase II
MLSDLVPNPAVDDRPLTDRLRHWAVERAHQRAFTFVDYPDPGSPGRHRTLTWGQLYSRAEAISAQVSEAARPGERAALLMPQGLDYVAAFLGCLLARVVAVPLFPPDLPGHERRIAAVLEDCEPACALMTPDGAHAALTSAFASVLDRVPIVPIDGARATTPARAVAPSTLAVHTSQDSLAIDPDEIAYLQYTSGSTRVPAGVMISHRNVVANALQGIAAFDTTAGPTTSVGWLPLFHDMGLVLSIAEPIVAGFPSVLMDPVAFLEKPERWLRLLGAYPGALSAAPNFAYEYCVAAVSAEQVADLRLDRVRALLNGSEPVRASTVQRFQQAFGGTGLPPQSQCPSYGLAEATVFVATNGPADAPMEVLCSREALSEGRIVPIPGDADQDQYPENVETGAGPGEGAVTSLVSCGVPVGQELRIIDPATKALLPQDVVGEIVVRGPNVGLGYWKRAEQSAEVFGVTVPGTGDQPWLRTGDLGAIHRERLLVTGRLKDLLIVDGRNHYPQDLEESVQTALDCVRKGRIAVFSVPGSRGDLAVAVAEHRRDLTPDRNLREEAARTARACISTAHGLHLHRLVLVPPGSVPRTSSGKVSRSACRNAFLRGEYELSSTSDPEREAAR